MHEVEGGDGRDVRGGDAGGAIELMRVMWSVDHGLNRLSKRMVAELGVTGPQRLVLRLLGREPGLSPARLAASLHLHASTVTGIVQRLERAGLVRRRRDPSDARRSLLVLTPRARRLVAPAPRTVEAAIAAALGAVPRADAAAARRLLGVVADELERALDAPPPAARPAATPAGGASVRPGRRSLRAPLTSAGASAGRSSPRR